MSSPRIYIQALFHATRLLRGELVFQQPARESVSIGKLRWWQQPHAVTRKAFVRCLKMEAIQTNETPEGVPALMIAGLTSDVETMEVLLKRKANAYAVQGNWPVLMPLILNNRDESVKCLLRAGADPNRTDDRGTSALMVAAMGGNNEIAAPLLQSGAEVNARDAVGKTALQNADMTGNGTMKRLLQEHGAIS